jgi:isoleucyl-tRNA synthetase
MRAMHPITFLKVLYTTLLPPTYISPASVTNALNHFANITLSSLYFDITKDCLYAANVQSHERRAVVTALEQVCFTRIYSCCRLI